MPTLNSSQLYELSVRILRGGGASQEEAACVAAELRDANLVGHDSHGVMRLVQYMQMVQDGHVQLGSRFEILKDGPAFALADAHFNFGQVAATKALDIALKKVKAAGTATVFVRNCNHIGRLGSYTERAAKQGCVGMMSVNSPAGGGVAPYGGIDRKLGTNPICIAAPIGNESLVLDMTTSATAEGKLRVSHQKGEQIAPGLLIDNEGRPSTDPADFYRDPPGAILPLGGDMAHKGYGLSVMIDIVCGIVSGSGIARADLPRGANGVWLYLLDIEHFISRDEYDQWMAKYVPFLKSSRTLPGVSEILLPGEIEVRRQRQREADGVNLPDETWRQIQETAAKLGVVVSDLATQ